MTKKSWAFHPRTGSQLYCLGTNWQPTERRPSCTRAAMLPKTTTQAEFQVQSTNPLASAVRRRLRSTAKQTPWPFMRSHPMPNLRKRAIAFLVHIRTRFFKFLLAISVPKNRVFVGTVREVAATTIPGPKILVDTDLQPIWISPGTGFNCSSGRTRLLK